MVNHFPLGRVAAEFYNDGRSIVLLRPFRYFDPNFGIDIIVPKFFTSDGNSSPRPVWWLFAIWDYPAAPVVHDFCFRNPPEGWSRANADWAHWRLLRLCGCQKWKAEIVFQILSKVSTGAWERYRAMDRVAVEL